MDGQIDRRFLIADRVLRMLREECETGQEQHEVAKIVLELIDFDWARSIQEDRPAAAAAVRS